MAVVAWTSPFTGRISISHDAIADLDGSCGDGVSYWVYVGTSQVLAVRLTNGNAAELPASIEHVRTGEPVYFIVGPGPSGDNGCDTTQLQITIDQLAG